MISVIGRTPVSALKARVSCESIEVPEYQPLIDRRPRSSARASIVIDSTAPITINVPLTARPPCTEFIASALVTVAKMVLAPPSFCRAAAGSSAELVRERHLILPAGDRDGPEAELYGTLHPEMTESAEADYRHRLAGPRATVAQGVEGRDARAHQGRRIDVRQIFRNARQRFRPGDHEIGISAVGSDAGNQTLGLARERVATTARVAIAAIAAMPAHFDPLSRGPSPYVGTDGIDDPDYLMAWHPRILNAGHQTVFGVAVAMADTAGLDLYPDRSGPGLWDLPFYQFKRYLCLRHLDDAHLRHLQLPQCMIGPFEIALSGRLRAGPARANVTKAAAVQNLLR